jgi:thiol-disulfide isomerase/thioredoxin
MKTGKKEWLLYFCAAVIMFIVPLFINTSAVSGVPPPFSGRLLSDNNFSLSIDKPQLIYFWAEWCGVCKISQPSLSAVLQDYRGVTVAVKSGDDKAVKNYLAQQGLHWQTLNDAKGELSQRYQVNGVPTVFVLNPHGEVAFAMSGYVSEFGLRLRLWLAQL